MTEIPALALTTRSNRVAALFLPLSLLAAACTIEGDGSSSHDRVTLRDALANAPTIASVFQSGGVIGDDDDDDGVVDPPTTEPPAPSNDCGAIETFETGKTPAVIRHVAASGCSDSSGNGSERSPFCTIGRALQGIQPGTAVRVHAGTYAGGANFSNIVGTASAPIWIGGAPGEPRPVISGGDEGIKFTAPLRYLVIHDMEVHGSSDHGINIDDGSHYDDENAVRWIVVRGMYFHHVGDGSGIDNCLKVSGVNDFALHENEFYRCGMASPSNASGDGIDLVGCHRGLIAGSFFHTRKAVQVKGGSADIEIRGNHTRYIAEGTQYRSFNLGGSTGSAFFRPSNATAEARNVRLIANVIEAQGAGSAFAFAGCVDCLVANNTIVNPDVWVGRVLWENKSMSAPRNGRFVNNLVYFDGARTGTEFQVGDSVTTASTFSLQNNLWFDWRNGSTPDVDGLPQTGAIYENPGFVDQDFHIDEQSPAAGAGVPLQQLTGDLAGACYGDAPSIGAYLP